MQDDPFYAWDNEPAESPMGTPESFAWLCLQYVVGLVVIVGFVGFVLANWPIVALIF